MLFFFRLNNHKMAGCLSTPLYLHLPLPWNEDGEENFQLGGGLPQDWNPV
jgi:hypothetical protein